jgi:hypothetical protein
VRAEATDGRRTQQHHDQRSPHPPIVSLRSSRPQSERFSRRVRDELRRSEAA